MEGYARWVHVSLGVGEGLYCVWSRLSTVLEGLLIYVSLERCV